MKEIPLTQGQVALVDDHWFEYLDQWKWHARWAPSAKTFYANRTDWINGRQNRKTILMHRVILDAPQGIKVDHRDHNGLNNRLDNIRLAPIGNDRNCKKYVSNTSGYKGVYWHMKNSNWVARIRLNGKNKSLGSFSNLLDAARAYNAAAHKYYGDFALLNAMP